MILQKDKQEELPFDNDKDKSEENSAEDFENWMIEEDLKIIYDKVED